MGIDFDASEVRALGSRMQSAGGRIGAKASAALRATALAIQNDAKALAPVGDTGDLRDSITVRVTGDGRTGTMAVEVGPTIEYGFYQEFGTSDMAPQPFLGPAFDANAPKYTAALATIAESEAL